MKAALIYGSFEKHTFCQCIGNIFKEAVPEILTCILIQLPQLINTFYASTMNDPAKLAGLGLGITLLNIAIFIPLTGLNKAVEKLVIHGMKYSESGNTYLNRGRLITTVFYIPLVVLIYRFALEILKAIG